jgi:hypothetical protein
MTRVDRTARLADLHEAAASQMAEAVAAMEACDKPGALAAMVRVMATMNEIGEVLVSGPLLPLLRVH